jgi:uncharacterized protein
MTSFVESVAALHVGTVASVAPDRITILLDGEAPQTTALNTGVPTTFPRLNSYVLLPNEAGAVVGLVIWLGIERAPSQPRTGPSAIDIIDLPYPQRKMIVTPVGTLIAQRGDGDGYRMERGVGVFPGIGDQVLLPQRAQLRAIVEPEGQGQRVELGTAVLAGNAKVSVDPDKLFGRHVAVLGNTGSGKSCTVAGLVRWSLEAAGRQLDGKSPNARFIVLDPNGEYGAAFAGVPGGVRRLRVPPVSAHEKPLVVPTWMWNGHEWGAFAQASPRVQRPLLMQALRDLRSAGGKAENDDRLLMRIHVRLLHARDAIRALKPTQNWPEAQDVGKKIERLAEDATWHADKVSDEPSRAALMAVSKAIKAVLSPRHNGRSYEVFGLSDFDKLVEAFDEAMAALPELPPLEWESEDAPIPFEPDALHERLGVLAQDEASGNAANFVATLLLRVRTMLADRRMRPVIAPNPDPSFEEWLAEVVGGHEANNGCVAVIDLSLVPSDVVHVVVAVLARIVFEATQRYRRLNGNELPTVLVLEEAHSFVRRHEHEDGGDAPTPSQLCRQTFERIAREGRKFGLGLVLSSQRPSELSATVLAQCNTFILHRLVNDRDQDLVARLVPDNLAGLLQELPTLPTRHAVLLGWATALPVLMQVRELREEHRPESADPAFWRTWVRDPDHERPIDWPAIVKDWIRGEPDARHKVQPAGADETTATAPANDGERREPLQ